MRKKIENKEPDRIVGVRFKQSEFDKLQADMKSMDYLSYSKYIREVVLRKKVTVQRVTITDRSIRNQINQATAQISRIGNNYNQLVKRINEVSRSKKKNGDPVINSKYLSYYLDKLQTATQKIIEEQKKIIEMVNLVRVDGEPDNPQN